MMKAIIKRTLRQFGLDIRRHKPDHNEREFVSLTPKRIAKGNVLVSYTLNPFRRGNGSFDISHVTDWECFHMVKTFLDMNYNVDVITFTDKEFIPKKDYAVFVDVLTNLERIGSLINKDCIKVFHPAWAHWLFHNSSNYQRHLELLCRRGIMLQPRILLQPNFAVENADYVTLRGGAFSGSTYNYARKPTLNIPHTAVSMYNWPKEKNYDGHRRNFLWLGGYGFVHKGLDLVLEAFRQMPEFNLYLCGRICNESEFDREYHREIYETENIHYMGWVDVTSAKFGELTNKCVGFVLASCSEISAGSVLVCLHAGLIPIVSYETDVEVNNCGIVLKANSVAAIMEAVAFISDQPSKQLESMSRRSWELARANYTRERFLEVYKKAALMILGEKAGG